MANKPRINSVDNPVNSLWLNVNKIGLDPEVTITIKNSKNKPIKDYSELLNDQDKNKVDIFLDFFPKTRTTRIEDDVLVAEYKLKARNSKEAYLRNKKEALIKYICDFLITSSESHKVDKEHINNEEVGNLECEIVKFSVNNNDGTKKEEIRAKLRQVGASTAQDITVTIDNTELIPGFNLPRKFDELITFPSPQRAPDPFWTWGKIISACVVIGIIAALIFFYRKKIWSWIKREDQTKKKEQVEIF